MTLDQICEDYVALSEQAMAAVRDRRPDAIRVARNRLNALLQYAELTCGDGPRLNAKVAR